MLTSTLRPGLLVVVRTAIRGNVSYNTIDLGTVATVEGEESKWETNRLVRDKAEQERAVKVRSLARSAIQTVCAKSDFGLLCPTEKTDRLNEAIEKARRLCADFNVDARQTEITFNVMCGRVSADDVEAVRSINREIRDLMQDMEQGLASLDVEKVRAAALKAKSVGQMLEPNAQGRVQKAIELARSAAKQIVKAGEEGAVEIDQVTIQRLVEARTSFLDLDDATEVQAPHAEGRALDLEPTRAKAPAFVVVDYNPIELD